MMNTHTTGHTQQFTAGLEESPGKTSPGFGTKGGEEEVHKQSKLRTNEHGHHREADQGIKPKRTHDLHQSPYKIRMAAQRLEHEKMATAIANYHEHHRYKEGNKANNEVGGQVLLKILL